MSDKIKVDVHKEPIYERVQVGSKDVEIYETTDGRKFYDKEDAKDHQNGIDAKEFSKENMRSYQTNPPFRSNSGCWYHLNSYRDLYLSHYDDRDYGDGYEVHVDGNYVGELKYLLESGHKLDSDWYLLTVQYNSSSDWVVAVYLTSRECAVWQLEASVKSFRDQIPE